MGDLNKNIKLFLGLLICFAVVVCGVLVWQKLGSDDLTNDPEAGTEGENPGENGGNTTDDNGSGGQGSGDGTQKPTAFTLETPVIEYDEENNIVSWNEIQNAEKYLLKVNGVEREIEETQAQVDIEEESNYTISVKALGDGKEYLDSEEASISGYRQDQNEVYYKNIESNIYKFFETYKFDGRFLTYVKDILNVEYEDNKLTVLFKCTTREETAPVMEYKEIIFDLNSVYSNDNVTLKTISEASNYIFDLNFNQINYRNLTDNIFSYGTGCYDVMIEDERLTGQLKEYLDNGYTATRLYSEISKGTEPDNFEVNSCIRLQKDDEIKIVTVQNFIYQKYINLANLSDYVLGYMNGAAEDVRIEESKFEENSSTSEIWQKAKDLYKSVDNGDI